jgi:hypothetical protein
MLAPKGWIRASRAWCVVWSAHRGPPLLHVAIRTGYSGGGYPMGLCRESAEDVEHPTALLLKAHSHVVELVESSINLLLPQLEVAQHTGSIHRIVTRLAMKLDGAGDVPHRLVDIPNCAHYHVIEYFVSGQCVLDCDFGHLLDVLLNTLRKGADIEG